MWTPKRILLLALGFVVFSVAYGVYAHFLGTIDGLPELPHECEADPRNIDPPLPTPSRNEVDRKLQLAFGPDCPEVKRPIKLEVRLRGIVLAAEHFTIEDGKVKLEPFSIAIFGKDKGDGQFPEINTVRSDIAYLRFDQEITTPADMANHRIVGGTLCRAPGSQHGPAPGGVTIVNNRRTPQTDDDLTLTTPGPVFYEESQHLIWTAEPVRLTDWQCKQSPTTINATGMDVYLLNENDPEGPQPAKRPPEKQATGHKDKNKEKTKQEGITGVKAVRLRSDVDMYLMVDARSGFLGSGKDKPPPGTKETGAGTGAAGKADKSKPTTKEKKEAEDASVMQEQPPGGGQALPVPPGKAPVHIHTQGPFLYDLLHDQARFDISQHPGPFPNHVDVERKNGPNGARDQLVCDHLELKFERKREPADPNDPAAPAPAADADHAMELEIESAHATGSQVILTSDLEVLTAFGNDLVYLAPTKQSTLKGSPVIALKDGNEIRAPEVVLIGVGEKEGQQARAKGPGEILMLDRTTNKHTLQARWKDLLVSGKDGQYDLLTLTGDAAFEEIDPDQPVPAGQPPRLKQQLKADRLKLWLLGEPEAQKDANTAPPAAGGNQSRRPHRVEALGHVMAKSAEMNVHDTEQLMIRFKDLVPGQDQLPTAQPAAGGDAQVPGRNADATPGGAPAKPGEPAKPGDPAANPKKPIDLSARTVEVQVLRLENKNELEKLSCEGTVRVHQDPETAQEKPTDIRGQKLQLWSFPEGHILDVVGEPAEVQLKDLAILGPEVKIDQKQNEVTVEGLGAMRMPSNANLAGGKVPEKPADKQQPEKVTELTVHWNRNMYFNGKYALFHGGVQAEQEDSILTCVTMQVFLNRFVSLKEEDKTAPPAKVENLVCDQSVRIVERQLDKVTTKMVGFKQILANQTSFNNEDGVMVAPGPGEVRTWEPGAKDDAPGVAPPPKPPQNGAAEEEMKLTRVTYLDRMFANNITRTAIFYGSVEVVHVATDNPNLSLDLDNLPVGALYLRCDTMKVYNQREANGKSNQQLEARGKSLVQSKEFWGRADVVKYDESKDLVIFEANPGNLATLYKVKQRGAAPEELKGKKIYYWRKTNQAKVEGGTGISGQEQRQ